MAEPSESSFTLRNLPLATRVLLAAFLITVGVGYVTALVQLHLQHASPGNMLPTPEDVENAYHGSHGISAMERLITANETLPFNSSGSMRVAFTKKSTGWVRGIREKAEAILAREKAKQHRLTDKQKERLEKHFKADYDRYQEKMSKENPKEEEKPLKEEEKEEEKPKESDLEQAEELLRQERELEINSMVEWIRAGGKEKNYTEFPVSDKLAKRFPQQLDALPPGLFDRAGDQIVVNVQNIFDMRCYRCHSHGKGGSAGEVHLDKFQVVQEYLVPEHGGGMPLRKLAQSTHVHMLGFGMLYGMTGLIFSLTSYPKLLRLVLAPFPLIMQVIDISFWWLARLPDTQYGPLFAHAIPITGGLVAIGLVIHIVFGTFNLFGTKGRLMLIVLFGVGAALAGMLVSTVVQPFVDNERLVGPAP